MTTNPVKLMAFNDAVSTVVKQKEEDFIWTQQIWTMYLIMLRKHCTGLDINEHLATTFMLCPMVFNLTIFSKYMIGTAVAPYMISINGKIDMY